MVVSDITVNTMTIGASLIKIDAIHPYLTVYPTDYYSIECEWFYDVRETNGQLNLWQTNPLIDGTFMPFGMTTISIENIWANSDSFIDKACSLIDATFDFWFGIAITELNFANI